MTQFTAGPTNGVADIAGVRVGHADRRGDGFLTGTTVIVAPEGGMAAGVDVRGGGPGTRETDLLAPTATVDRVHALVLTGGSAYGLAAADGVAAELGRRGIGLPVGTGAGEVVPIVPAAVLFDLGRGGSFTARPDRSFGIDAVMAADTAAGTTGAPAGSVCGAIGAGTGAVSGGLKGGIGTASTALPGGGTVAALMAVNSVGSVLDSATGLPWALPYLLPGDVPPLRQVSARDRAALAAVVDGALTGPAPTPESLRHTVIGAVITDTALDKTQCTALARIAHDGLARAINPVHTLFDGDTVFAASTGSGTRPDLAELHLLYAAAATTVARAIVRAIVMTDGVRTAGGHWRGYLEVAPSARAGGTDRG